MPVITAESGVPEFKATPTVAPLDVAGWDTVFDVRRADDVATTRAEVAASPRGFEFTFVRLVQAGVTGLVRYSFVVPHAFLDGQHAEIVGTGVKTPASFVQKNQISGPLGAGGISNVNPILYLRARHPKGAVDFDFNPRGFWIGESTMTPRAAEWSMKRTAEGYVFSTAFSRTQQGTLQEFKFAIRPADARPVWDVHPRVAARWTTGYRNMLRLSAGADAIDGHIALPGERASWRDAASVRIERDARFRDTGRTRYEGASPVNPDGSATLEIDAGRAGYYLVNLLAGSPDRAIGPCEAEAGMPGNVTLPAIPKGEYDSWALVAFTGGGRIAINFRGDFRIAAAGIAPLMYENEDFLFRRDWWLSPDWRPEGGLLDRLLPECHPARRVNR
jgi:hypothetical protein